MVKISIIVPVYNKAEFLASCLESILAQTMDDFELIVVNDGSKDNSGEIIDTIAAKDKRVIAIHQENGGVSAARNMGLKVAKGKYIGFVDADDILEKDMYELLYNNAIKHDADISMCGVKRIFPDKEEQHGGEDIFKVYNQREGLSGLLNGEILLSNYDKLFKRETVQGIWFEPALFEDTFYNFEALKNAKKTIFDGSLKYLYIIRENSHSMSAYGPKYFNTLKMTKKMLDICKQELPDHESEAKSFDFNTNMLVLNLILLDSQKNNLSDYKQVVTNLKQYSGYYAFGKHIKMRYKLGYSLFRISPRLYTKFLNFYVNSSRSEHLERKGKILETKES